MNNEVSSIQELSALLLMSRLIKFKRQMLAEFIGSSTLISIKFYKNKITLFKHLRTYANRNQNCPATYLNCT